MLFSAASLQQRISYIGEWLPVSSSFNRKGHRLPAPSIILRDRKLNLQLPAQVFFCSLIPALLIERDAAVQAAQPIHCSGILNPLQQQGSSDVHPALQICCLPPLLPWSNKNKWMHWRRTEGIIHCHPFLGLCSKNYSYTKLFHNLCLYFKPRACSILDCS